MDGVTAEAMRVRGVRSGRPRVGCGRTEAAVNQLLVGNSTVLEATRKEVLLAVFRVWLICVRRKQRLYVAKKSFNELFEKLYYA